MVLNYFFKQTSRDQYPHATNVEFSSVSSFLYLSQLCISFSESSRNKPVFAISRLIPVSFEQNYEIFPLIFGLTSCRNYPTAFGNPSKQSRITALISITYWHGLISAFSSQVACRSRQIRNLIGGRSSAASGSIYILL